jgi:hypothetical protein
VAGAPRTNAVAKDSEWVRERTALEVDKPAEANEVLLATPGMGNTVRAGRLAVSHPCVHAARDDHVNAVLVVQMARF